MKHRHKPKCSWLAAIFSVTLMIFYSVEVTFALICVRNNRNEGIMRKVFFSFDWDDVFRADQVRNSWVPKDSYTGPVSSTSTVS